MMPVEAWGGSSNTVEARGGSFSVARLGHGQHERQGQKPAVPGSRVGEAEVNGRATGQVSDGSGRRCLVRSEGRLAVSGAATTATAEENVMVAHR
jgi:hypothetical protein